MDFLENRHEKTNQDGNKERDEDSVELPLDSLAILQEFLQNKTMQRSLECEEIFEEDWVQPFFTLTKFIYGCSMYDFILIYYCFLYDFCF